MQGSELIKLENTETYQTKLKQLMEELRFAKEKQLDQTDKLVNEQSAVQRQIERVDYLEKQLEPYAKLDLGAEIRELESRNAYEQEQNSELIQRIIDLEREQAAKVQENRLLMLKFKNMDLTNLPDTAIGLGGKSSIDKSVYKSHSRDERGLLGKSQPGSTTNRSASRSSVGKLEPIAKPS